MTKQTGLSERLAALLSEEKARCEAVRQQLCAERDRLGGELKTIEAKLSELDEQFAREVKQSLKQAGIRLDAPAGTSAGRAAGRGSRGKNRQWVAEQFATEKQMTRASLLEKAELAGLKGSSISQELYKMAKAGLLVEAAKQGRQTVYKLA